MNFHQKRRRIHRLRKMLKEDGVVLGDRSATTLRQAARIISDMTKLPEKKVRIREAAKSLFESKSKYDVMGVWFEVPDVPLVMEYKVGFVRSGTE